MSTIRPLASGVIPVASTLSSDAAFAPRRSLAVAERSAASWFNEPLSASAQLLSAPAGRMAPEASALTQRFMQSLLADAAG